MEININNVSFSYSKIGYKNNTILENINTTIKKGEITSIIGSKSSGVTTLFELITSNLSPTKGNIENNISDKAIGYSYQIPSEQFLASTVEEELTSCIILNDLKKI